MNESLVSIVVCTHNRAAMLRDALASLTQLRTDGAFEIEVVVIDNASSDATADVAREIAANSPLEVRYHYEAKKGIASARNRGLREARGEWIAFFDDDQLADPAWLTWLVGFARTKDLRCVGGAVHLRLPEGCERKLHAFVRMLLGESLWSETPMPYTLKIGPGAGNLMIHRTVIDRVGGFDEQFQVRSEDTDLWRRMVRAGYEGWYVPQAIVHHVTPPLRLEFDYLARLASGMGAGLAEREAEDRSTLSFGLRWFAKALRGAIVEPLAQFVSRMRGDIETALGYRLRGVLSAAYRETGYRELLKHRTPVSREALHAPRTA